MRGLLDQKVCLITGARTIADLDHADRIDTLHVAEALQYRHREGD